MGIKYGLFAGMDYSDSDIYVGGNSSISETLGPPRYPIPNTAKRSLEDRVRDYTGFRQVITTITFELIKYAFDIRMNGWSIQRVLHRVDLQTLEAPS